MDRTALLQTLRLKGLAPASILAEALGVAPGDLDEVLAALDAEGLAQALPRGVRLSEAGRAALEEALASERTALDRVALEALYESFDAVNTEFKQVVADWQLRPSGGELAPNDHSDPEYDRGVLERLLALHERFAPLARSAADLLPRLETYARRFGAARERIAAGETRFVAAPLIDSYHSVWFEFHEELLQASGRSRAAEAAAGRAD